MARSVLVLKKLGDDQRAAFLRVLHYLGVTERMRVVVEPHEYLKLGAQQGLDYVDTYNKDEASRCTLQSTLVCCH